MPFHHLILQESKQRKGGREYFFDLKKKDFGFWPRLLKEKNKVCVKFCLETGILSR